MFHKWGVSCLQMPQDTAFRAAPLQFMGTPWEEGDCVKPLFAGRDYWSHAISSENVKKTSEAAWDQIKDWGMYQRGWASSNQLWVKMGTRGIFESWWTPSMPPTLGIHRSSTSRLSPQTKIYTIPQTDNKSIAINHLRWQMIFFPGNPGMSDGATSNQTSLNTVNGTRA